jgi:FkbM family methyltransferase
MISAFKLYHGYILYTKFYFYKYYGLWKSIKGIIFFHYRAFKKLFQNPSTERIVEVNGYKMLLIPYDEGISTELLLFKTHEPLSTEILKKLLKSGMTCIDIGSNIGYYALLERRIVGEKGKVIAIEPSPINLYYLRRNIALNRFNDVEVFNYAFSNFDGECLFLHDKRHSNLSKVLNNDIEKSCESQLFRIPCKRLDSFLKEHPLKNIDFIRMDVEGHEAEIIIGGYQTIRTYKPILFLEIHKGILGLNKTLKLLKTLEELGYTKSIYIPRELNMPLIGSEKDVQTCLLNEISKKIHLIPDYFHLILFHKAHQNAEELL